MAESSGISGRGRELAVRCGGEAHRSRAHADAGQSGVPAAAAAWGFTGRRAANPNRENRNDAEAAAFSDRFGEGAVRSCARSGHLDADGREVHTKVIVARALLPAAPRLVSTQQALLPNVT